MWTTRRAEVSSHPRTFLVIVRWATPSTPEDVRPNCTRDDVRAAPRTRRAFWAKLKLNRQRMPRFGAANEQTTDKFPLRSTRRRGQATLPDARKTDELQNIFRVRYAHLKEPLLLNQLF